MRNYTISENRLRTFIEEELLLECLMENDPPLEEIKAGVIKEEKCSWDDLVDTIMKRFIEIHCVKDSGN